MRFQSKLVFIGLALGFFWLATGCNSTSYVQDIIPAEVDPPRWYLSPAGDKLLYNTRAESEHAIIRFLATGQEVTIAACPWFSWLDDETVYCYDYQEPQDIPVAVIGNISANAGAFSRTSIKAVTADQAQLDTWLDQAKAIYRLHPFSGSDSLLVDTELQKNTKLYYHISSIKDLDKVLKKYHSTTIFLSGSFVDSANKIHSPNGKYYYLLQDSLRIYDEASDRLLTEFKPQFDYKSYFQIPGSYPTKSEGWAADSSGVYFQIYHSSGFGPRLPVRPIQKLCVPGASGCAAGK